MCLSQHQLVGSPRILLKRESKPILLLPSGKSQLSISALRALFCLPSVKWGYYRKGTVQRSKEIRHQKRNQKKNRLYYYLHHYQTLSPPESS